jgi:uncharacterized C2H2 Zn-finger protein
MDGNPKTPQNPQIFSCQICDYSCSNKKDYKKHLLTRKHQKKEIINDLTMSGNKKIPINVENEKKFACESCNKVYKDNSGLWRHKKKCLGKKEETLKEEEKEPKKDNDIVLLLLKENQEFKQLIIEQNKQNSEMQKQMLELVQKPTTTINGNNNCNNRFNLNVFLNEKCKDAMNIMDFVDSLKLTLQDLEKTAELGYVKGITNIIMNGLNQLDVCKRPIHCSDLKRETLYIKDNNAWEKENDEKKKITRAIRHISIKNAKQVGEWTKENKGYNDSSSKKNDKYLKIVSEANGGEPEEINKIISNVSSKVTIDKQMS